VAESRGQFENPEEGERSPLEAVTIRLVKTVTENTSVSLTVICNCSNELHQS
jgi:hypothetical protein